MLRLNRSWRVGVCSFLALAAGCVWVEPAAAQASDAAMAESLFREGKRLSAEHKYAEACPKFAESYKLDHGLGTLLNLATCHESEGKPASAWAEFSEAMAQAKRKGDSERAQLADEHMRALEPKLAHVSIGAAPGANVPGLVIKFDSNEVSGAALGVQFPVDPGKHVLEASAPGKQPYAQTFETPASNTVLAVTVPALQAAPGATAAMAAAPTPTAAAPAAAAPAATASSSVGAASPSSRPNTGLIASGVVTGAFAVGTIVTAILYSSKRSDFDSANNANDDTRFDKRDSAKTLGTVNLVFTGGTLISAGFLVYFLATGATHEAPPPSTARLRVEPLLAPNGGGLVLRGAL